MKRIAFITYALLILVMAAATAYEKLRGTEATVAAFYGSVWFAALWGVMTVAAVGYMLRRLRRRPAAMLLHAAFAVILAGALLTRLTGERGTLHLRRDATATTFASERDGTARRLPFAVTLTGFEVVYYPGTHSPMDYVSHLRLGDAACVVSMNHIARREGYRFYQSGYDADGDGTLLAVCHDPWGIAVTYTGYGLLLVAMIAFLCHPREGFGRRVRLLHRRERADVTRRDPTRRRTITLVMLLLGGMAAGTGASMGMDRKTLPRATAAEFGELYVLWNGRICPLQTVARDFTTKLSGRTTVDGYTAEQVFLGWYFYPTSWRTAPMIRVKGAARRILGVEGRYASLADFISPRGGDKVSEALDSLAAATAGRAPTAAEAALMKSLREAYDKYNLIAMHMAGQTMRLYPARSDTATTRVRWLSPGDDLPAWLPDEEWMFVKRSVDYIGELAARRDFAAVGHVISKIADYQRSRAADVLPSPTATRAERAYNALSYPRLLVMALLATGLVAYLVTLVAIIRRRRVAKGFRIAFSLSAVAAFGYLAVLIVLRGVVGGHVPLGDGRDTMRFLALCALLVAVLLRRPFPLSLPFGLLLGGFAMLVSMLGEADPPVTPLMPVLASPLLSLHVAVIMVAYALLAFTWLDALTALILLGKTSLTNLMTHKGLKARSGFEVAAATRLMLVSRVLLYPALFLLAAGIFIGAVWANVSWGRYWGWDPKETWALITLMLYALALHGQSLPWLRRPAAFHGFLFIAFLAVLMTYFGVNFLLGGMHSYAGG